MKNTQKGSVLQEMFLTAFITTALMELSTVGAGLIDGVIISRFLGADSMAALGIAYPFFSIAGVMSGVPAAGMKLLNGEELARGRVRETHRIFTMTMLVGLALALLMTALTFAFPGLLARILGAIGSAAGLQDETSAYLKGLAYGCVPMILTVILAEAVHIDSGSRLVQISAVAGAVTDIVFDILAARLGWGMFGMGLATSISQFVGFAILLLHFRHKDAMLHLTLEKLPWDRCGSLVKLGSEKATRRALNFARPLLMNAMIIAAGGAMGMSALSVRNNMGNFIAIPMTGIAEAVALLTGIAYGEKNKTECRKIGRLAQKYVLISGTVIVALLAVGGGIVADFFVPEAGELRGLVRFSMYCLAGETVFSSLLASRISYLQATRQLKKSQTLVLMSKLTVIVPCALVCVQLWGSRGVILSYALSDMLICIVIFGFNILRLRVRGGKDRKHHLPSGEDYLALPADFDVEPQNIIELKVLRNEEAVLAAEQLRLFCEDHAFDAKRANSAALCLEELTTNIIEHGFPNCRKIQPIDVRVIMYEEDIILRIRDNCPLYDINEVIRTVENNTDPGSYMGMKIIAKTAKEISYVSMLETNVTIIRI